MRRVVLTLPDQPFGETNLTDEQMADEIQMLAAIKLYEMGRISSGYASALAGVPRVDFLHRVGEYGVSPFQVTPEVLRQDLENLRADLDQ